jgi:hypothetical protein
MMRINWKAFREIAQISNDEMDRKRAEYPNLVTGGFFGIPFYASPDGRTLPLTCEEALGFFRLPGCTIFSDRGGQA